MDVIKTSGIAGRASDKYIGGEVEIPRTPLQVIHARLEDLRSRISQHQDMLRDRTGMIHGIATTLVGEPGPQADANGRPDLPGDVRKRETFSGALGAVDDQIRQLEEALDEVDVLIIKRLPEAIDRLNGIA